MADLLMVVTMIGFVLLCVAYVGWCDRIVERADVAGDRGEVEGDPVAAREGVAA